MSHRNFERDLHSFVNPERPLPDHQHTHIAERMGIEETREGQWVVLVTPYGEELFRAGVCHVTCPSVVLGVGFSTKRVRHLFGCAGSTSRIHCVMPVEEGSSCGKHHHGEDAKKLLGELKHEAIQNAILDARKNLAKLRKIV